MTTLADAGAEDLMSILTSETLALMPSDSDTPLQIHERLLSSVSPTLRAVYQGSWEESSSRVYRFLKDDDGFYDHVTRELLTCFIRWAYLGDYATEMVGVSSHVEERARAVAEQSDPYPEPEMEGRWGAGFAVRGNYKRCKRCKRWEYEGERLTMREPEPEPEPERLSRTGWREREAAREEEPTQDASEADETQGDGSRTRIKTTTTTTRTHPLFLHIQLYVFANIYLIEPLKATSKQKMVDYLDKVERCDSRDAYTDAIFDLLDYAFSYLPDSDPLLDWLARYASWNLTALRKEPESLDNLLKKPDGRFAGLLVSHLAPSQRNPFASLSYR